MFLPASVMDEVEPCSTFIYLFVPKQLYMFRAMFSPIIRSI